MGNPKMKEGFFIDGCLQRGKSVPCYGGGGCPGLHGPKENLLVSWASSAGSFLRPFWKKMRAFFGRTYLSCSYYFDGADSQLSPWCYVPFIIRQTAGKRLLRTAVGQSNPRKMTEGRENVSVFLALMPERDLRKPVHYACSPGNTSVENMTCLWKCGGENWNWDRE
jgi:hypothetical protein